MLDHVDISLCPCSTFRDIEAGSYVIREEDKEEAVLVCSWPSFHSDIATLKETGKILHVAQGQLVENPLKDTRIGKSQKNAIKLMDEDAIIQMAEKRAVDVVKHLSERLENKVYREKDIKMIQVSRVLLGAHSTVQSVVARGAQTVANLTCEKFFESSVEVDPGLLERVSKEEFKLQYREYMRRLEVVSKEPIKRKMSDMELLELFLEPENHHLYRDIESVMSVMVRASLVISVESVVESWISVMEHHASQRRTLGEMMLHEEMVIAINGPRLVHCDSVVQEAIKSYFSDRKNPKERSGHFIRRSEDILSYNVSKCVDRVRSVEPKKAIMQ